MHFVSTYYIILLTFLYSKVLSKIAGHVRSLFLAHYILSLYWDLLYAFKVNLKFYFL